MNEVQSQELQRMLEANAARLLDFINRKMPPDIRRSVEAQDVLQDTFFEAFQRIGQFSADGEEAAFRWLVTIARHRILAIIRSQRSAKRGGRLGRIEENGDVVALLQDLAIYSRTPSLSAMSHEVAAAVQRSISKIEAPFREIIHLRFVEGLSHRESAARLGSTENAIGVLCHRALKALRVHLEALAIVT
jgi:RNA polymerase sigma-70 factor (ECF subfamily)